MVIGSPAARLGAEPKARPSCKRFAASSSGCGRGTAASTLKIVLRGATGFASKLVHAMWFLVRSVVERFMRVACSAHLQAPVGRPIDRDFEVAVARIAADRDGGVDDAEAAQGPRGGHGLAVGRGRGRQGGGKGRGRGRGRHARGHDAHWRA